MDNLVLGLKSSEVDKIIINEVSIVSKQEIHTFRFLLKDFN